MTCNLEAFEKLSNDELVYIAKISDWCVSCMRAQSKPENEIDAMKDRFYDARYILVSRGEK